MFLFVRYVSYFHFCKYLHCCIVEVGVFLYIFRLRHRFSVFEEFKVEPHYKYIAEWKDVEYTYAFASLSNFLSSSSEGCIS